MKEIYRKNEWETNEFVSKAIRLLLIITLLFGILCWIKVLDIYNYMINGFILSSLIPLIFPTVIVDVLHINKKWVKYVLILCVVIVTGIAYAVFTFQIIIVFVLPSILAAFYLDKKVMIFTGSVSVLNIIVSHLITCFHLFEPWIEPFIGIKSIMLYGALPRILQYLCCMILLQILSIRISKFLDSFYSVIEEKSNINHKENEYDNVDYTKLETVTKLLTEREREVFGLMVTGYTNSQIANQLYISNGTVKNYVSSIYDKIGSRDRTALILKYSQYYQKHD